MSPIAAAFFQYWEHSSLQSISITFLLSIILLFISISTFKNNTRKLNLPPSPNKLPIIGNLHQLGTLPHHSLQTLAQKHGPLMILHLGLSPTLVVSSPQAAQEIMKTHDLIFSSRPNQTFAKKLLYGKDVAFTPYCEYWRQMRKICILELLSAKRVQSFRTIREEETDVMIQNISTNNQVVNLSLTIVTLTSDVICRVAFGKKYSGEGKRFGEILGELYYLLGVFNVGDFIPWLGWMNHLSGLNARLDKCFQEMDCFIEGVIEDHIEKKKKKNREGRTDDEQDECKEDLVDVLLGINNPSGVVGGTSLGIDSIKGIILLEQNVSEDDLQKMHYLQCIIKETLRLHPPAPLLIPRESTEASKIHGYDIPAKTRVFVNAYAIGRDPDSWKEPNKFEPGRFMDSSADYKGHDFEFIPFGAGRRGCPGIGFATATIELALANLLFRFDWKLAGDGNGVVDMTEASGLVVRKKFPLLVVAIDHFSF